MEYIIVKVSKKNGPALNYIELSNGIKLTPKVTINGDVNGCTGKILEIEAGESEISIKASIPIKSEIVKLKLNENDTSTGNPKEVIVNVA